VKTKQGGQGAFITDRDNKRVVLFIVSQLLQNKTGLLPDRRIPVDSIRRDSQVERSLDPDKEFNR
jgi:hypothetical protein